jgi:hypothetical protein
MFVRSHYIQLVATAAVLVLPLATFLALALPEYLAWSSLLVWWCKPIWERAQLFMLSRSLFEDRPSIRQTLRALAGYGFRDWLPALTIRRVSLMRSFDMPVAVLEGSQGLERAARLGVLHRGGFPSAAAALTVLLVHLEFGLVLGILLLAQILTPEGVDWNVFSWVFGFEGEETWAGQVFVFYATVIAILLVAPFYVVGGFSLYLHRRTELEAWDLELAFRRLASRICATRPTQSSVSRVSGMMLSGVFLGALASAPMESVATELTPVESHKSIEAILEGDAFHRIDTIRLPRSLLEWEFERDAETAAEYPIWLIELTDRLGSLVGGGAEVFLVALGLGCVGWLVIRVAQHRGVFSGRPDAERLRQIAPTELFGLQVTEESLPADLVAEALESARAQDGRSALGLLYRGALVRLGFIYGLELSGGVTERECLDAARPLMSGEAAAYFDRLTATWLRCAYGHIEPDADRLEGLCLDWSQWFEVPDVPGDGRGEGLLREP